MIRRSRRCAAIAAMSFLVVSASTASAHSDLTVVNFGGDSARAQMLTWLRPWEDQTGKYTEMEYYNGGLAEIREQVETANVKWDVVDMEYSEAIQACDEGLLEPIDRDRVAGADDFREGAVTSCGVGNFVWATVYAYDADRLKGTPPTTIADFFDIKKFPGKRGIRRDPRGLLEWALMADGVAVEDVYRTLATPEGLDRAFKAMEPLKNEIEWWSTGGEPADLLEGGHVTMSMAWNGRLFSPVAEDGLNLVTVWDGQIWEYDLYVIPKGARNRSAALDFINYATTPEKQAEFAGMIPYGPTRISSAALIDAETMKLLPTYDANMENALRYDSQWWSENLDVIRPRFELFATKERLAKEAQSDRF